MLTTLLVSMLAAEPGGLTDAGLTAEASLAPGLGGTVAPAALGAGTIALYGYVGAPEVAVGYRQGFAPFEVEGRLVFNVFEVSALLEGGAKVPLLRRGRLLVAVGGMLGLKANSGATYYDLGNFASWALRPAILGLLSYELSEVVAAVARAEVPLAVSLDVRGVQFTPTLSLGGEAHLGQGVSLLVLGRLGLDAREGPSGWAQARVAWGVQLGVGYRVF